MKKITLVIVAITFGFNIQSFAQKLEENKTDDFTKSSIKSTSWETLSSSMSINEHFRISKINKSEYLDVKIMIGSVFAINKDQEMMLKLDNNDVITLQSNDYEITSIGGGSTGFIGSQAEGLSASYLLNDDEIQKLRAHKVVKVRIATSAGDIDEDVKDKNAQKIINALNLIQ